MMHTESSRDDYEHCQAIHTDRETGDQKPAIFSAYAKPIFFCDECLRECMEDASPEERATVRTTRLEEHARGIERAARIGRAALVEAAKLQPALESLVPFLEPMFTELESLAKSIRKDF